MLGKIFPGWSVAKEIPITAEYTEQYIIASGSTATRYTTA